MFDRDFKSFFPLSVVRKTAVGEESVSISNLSVGDKLILRNGELIPADAKLINGAAFIDYSFVTGESEPLAKREGDYLYAGGKQIGAAIELETLKPVSHSYLTSLWNHEAFQKDRTTISTRSRTFTAAASHSSSSRWRWARRCFGRRPAICRVESKRLRRC